MMVKIRDTGKRIYPKKTVYPKVIERFFPFLTETQEDGIHRTLGAAYDSVAKRGLIEDGPGVGKTMQILACAWHASKTSKKPSLYLTTTEALAQQVLTEIDRVGIRNRRVQVRTFDDPGAISGDWGAIFIDESHRSKEHGWGKALDLFDGPVIFASGSAYASPAEAVYTTARLMKVDDGVAADRLGLSIIEGTAAPRSGLRWRDCLERIKDSRTENFRRGRSVCRRLVFDGEAVLAKVPNARESCDTLAAATKAVVKSELKAGRKVVCYARKELRSKLEEMFSSKLASGPQALNNGEASVLLLDPDEEAEGLRLHDKRGNSPRSVVLAEWVHAASLVQIEGRVSRRNAKTTVRILALYDKHADRDVLMGVDAELMVGDMVGVARPALARAIESELKHPDMEARIDSMEQHLSIKDAGIGPNLASAPLERQRA